MMGVVTSVSLSQEGFRRLHVRACTCTRAVDVLVAERCSRTHGEEEKKKA